MRIQDDNASFRFNQTGLRKFLGDLECEIMELVWKKANPTVTVREVFEALKKERQIAYTTVMTTMVRLSEKGLLIIVDKAGLANCYSPADTREKFIHKSVSWVLKQFSKDFPTQTQEYFAKSKTKKH